MKKIIYNYKKIIFGNLNTKIQYGIKTSNLSHDNNNFIKPEIICDKCKRYEHY